MLNFLACLALSPLAGGPPPIILQGQKKPVQAAGKQAAVKPATPQASGEAPILQGKDMAGPVTLKFQLSSPVRYLVTSTRRITGSGTDLVAKLKGDRFKEENGQWARTRRWGVTWNPQTSGFEAVPGAVPAHAIMKFRREYFVNNASDNWQCLFLENGAKVDQQSHSSQERVGDSQSMQYNFFTGMWDVITTPKYETKYYTTNSTINQVAPLEPFKLPAKVSIGRCNPLKP